jgi:2-succinyl-6-hydroxy-2,4-cyclohexadiene-1-carboxylate synthase
LTREEKLYDKEKISEVLLGFSLGKQEDLRQMIKDVSIPMLWISGELDSKFACIGKEMELINKNIKSVVFPNVGHRVPWEIKEKFTSLCKDFFQKIDR